MERKNMWEHYTKEKEREGKRTGGTGSQIQKMSGSVQDGERMCDTVHRDGRGKWISEY